MRKTVTPIVAIILLVVMTIGSSGLAFFWVSGVQSSISETTGSSVEESGLGACSRLNLISMRGDSAVVQNVGCDEISNVTVLIDGVLTNYDLDSPIAPGEAKTILFSTALSADEEHTVGVVGIGFSSQEYVTKNDATAEAGYNPPNYAGCEDGTTVVDWENNIDFNFNTDRVACFCNSSLPTNLVSNSGFENSLDDWTTQTGSSQTISITSLETHSGTNALNISSTNPDYNTVALAYQQLSTQANNISTWVYSANPSTTGHVTLIAKFYLGAVQKQIYYILFENGLSGMCGTYQGDGDVYVDCSASPTANQWSFVSFNPVNDFITAFGYTPTNYDQITVLVVAGTANALYDDVGAYETADREYCDSDNYGAQADGVCYEGECIHTYIVPTLDTRTKFFTTENPPISIEIINFNDSAVCNLEFDSTDYDMTVTSTTASYTLPSQYDWGTYFANVTCDNDIYQESSSNVTSSLIFSNWTLEHANFNDFADSRALYHTVGELNSNYAGKEIIIVDKGTNTLHAISSGGEYIGSETFYAPIDGVIAADLDQNGDDELVVTIQNNTYIYSDAFHYLISMYPFGESSYFSGVAVADFNAASGLEILDARSSVLYAYESDGSALWSFSPSGTSNINAWSGISSPTVADINTANSGDEILFTSQGNALFMLDSSGNPLYWFNITNDFSAGYLMSPAVAELNNSYDGLEIVYAANTSETEMGIYILNSTLGEISKYTYTWRTSVSQDANYYLTPKSVAIGDVNGDGENNIVVSLFNISDWDSDVWFDDHLLILYANGSVLNDYVNSSHNGYVPVLLELDSNNPGLEIVAQERPYFKIINSSGETLYSYQSGNYWATGPVTIADDIDGDGKLEIIVVSSNEVIELFETNVDATNNNWPVYQHDYAQTGYQD